MAKPQRVPGRVATEMRWAYYALNFDKLDSNYYRTLQAEVAQEITRRTQQAPVWVGRQMQIRLQANTFRARLINIQPWDAQQIGPHTACFAEYVERDTKDGQDVTTFLAEIIRYPNEDLGASYQSLVGIDTIKQDIIRKLTLLLSPQYVESWMKQYFPTNAQSSPTNLAQALRDRYPLIVLEGEVGAGKTALARSIGHILSTQLHQEILLFVLNAQVRGSGLVGEMTKNIGKAFDEAEKTQESEAIPIIILIDEADALAQARGGRQTHHEDDAGVNMLIQRIDRLRGKPMAVIFATNLALSLDRAILRRAIAVHHFDRPNSVQRAELFQRLLLGAEFSQAMITACVRATEPRELPGLGNRKHRYTYSDISQRILPTAVETAIYSRQPLREEQVLGACQVIMPTPEMDIEQGL